MKKRKQMTALVLFLFLSLSFVSCLFIPPIPVVQEEEEVVEVAEVKTAEYIPPEAYVFTDDVDGYLEWKTTHSGSYQHLIDTGRAVLKGEHTYPMSDGFREAAIIAAMGDNIDTYLSGRGSPLAGYGVNFAREGRRVGVCPYLLVALTAAESTFATDGSLSRTHHNCWGMKGPNKTGLYAVDGWMWWPDWESAIAGAAYFVDCYWPNAQSAYDCRGYCAGNPSPWFQTVEYIRGQLIGSL